MDIVDDLGFADDLTLPLDLNRKLHIMDFLLRKIRVWDYIKKNQHLVLILLICRADTDPYHIHR